MAVIVTVHGTFASGPEDGSKWWQRGSDFEAQMRELVEGADGSLEVVPHAWDGANSEHSRRAAGASLAERLTGFEQQGTPYSIIGHSHGGSVILAALSQLAHKRIATPGLSRWITVGTPFISFAKKRILFSRLGILGKAVWVSLFMAIFMFIFGFSLAMSDENGKLNDIGGMLAMALTAVTVFAFIHLSMAWRIDQRVARSGASFAPTSRHWMAPPQLGLPGKLAFTIWLTVVALFALIGSRQLEWPLRSFMLLVGLALVIGFPYAAAQLSRFVRFVLQQFGHATVSRRSLVSANHDRWIGLQHPQDEAIEGLRQVSHMRFKIFAKRFAAAPLTLAGVALFPLLICVALVSPDFMNWFTAVLLPENLHEPGMIKDGRLIGEGRNIRVNALALMIIPVAAVANVLPFMSWIPHGSSLSVLLFVVMMPVIYVLGSILLVATASLVASGLSQLLSATLDNVAWRQIRASAYGNDTVGEISLTAADCPPVARPFVPLPPSLSSEIGAVADAAAIASLARLRTSLNQLAFADDGRARSDLVSTYLTGEELVHTSYFKVHRFNKLVAYAIAHSPGFQPSPRFLADPDFAMIAAWHEVMTRHGRSAPNGGQGSRSRLQAPQ